MIVRTVWHFTEPPETVWPLLCDSRMEPAASFLFALGLPKPKECRVPQGPPGVGSTRQCVSDRGVIDQTILIWEEPRHLAFRMDRTDLWLRRYVQSIDEDFELALTEQGGTRATRTTRAEVTGRFRRLKEAALRVGLRKIHRFVFRNWAELSPPSAAPASEKGRSVDKERTH